MIGEQSHYQLEGFYREPFEMRNVLMQRLLTYDPNIVLLACSPDDECICKLHWPFGKLYRADPLEPNHELQCDLLWVDSEGSELYFLEKAMALLNQAKVVYTSTHFFHQSAYYHKLKQHLESFGFTLLSHWYKPGQNGNAIFVRKEIFEAYLRSLNYSPSVPKFLQRLRRHLKSNIFYALQKISRLCIESTR